MSKLKVQERSEKTSGGLDKTKDIFISIFKGIGWAVLFVLIVVVVGAIVDSILNGKNATSAEFFEDVIWPILFVIAIILGIIENSGASNGAPAPHYRLTNSCTK